VVGGRLVTGMAATIASAVCAAGCSSTPNPPTAATSASSSGPQASAPSTGSPQLGASKTPTPGSARSTDSLLPNQGNGGYDIAHYAIAIAYDPATRVLTGTDTVTATATQALSSFDLDLHALTVTSVTIGGKAAKLTLAHDKVTVTPARPIGLRTAFTAKIKYGGVPRPYNGGAFGLQGFIAQPDGALVQGQPQVAATWFPVNDSLTDKASYDITITAPTGLATVSNGVLASKRVSGPLTTWRWVESSPMASYLAIVAIGKYRVTMTKHNGLRVVLAVADALPPTVDRELSNTPTILDFLISQFGKYPFNSVGGIVYTQTNLDSLENQTRPSYSSDDFDSADDANDLMAHELAHQWFGDNVTIGDWSDIWLNEGFATYAEWLWSQHIGGQTPKQHFDKVYNESDNFPLDPPAMPTLNSLFDDTVYTRGAVTLEALRIVVGDTTFWRIIRGWAQLHAGGDATTGEFIAYTDQISGRSLDAFLHSWLYERGKPPYPQPLR
jgi:aminopeptidase N